MRLVSLLPRSMPTFQCAHYISYGNGPGFKANCMYIGSMRLTSEENSLVFVFDTLFVCDLRIKEVDYETYT